MRSLGEAANNGIPHNSTCKPGRSAAVTTTQCLFHSFSLSVPVFCHYLCFFAIIFSLLEFSFSSCFSGGGGVTRRAYLTFCESSLVTTLFESGSVHARQNKSK